MNWFGGVMNGNNTAFELQTEFASAGTSQTLRKGSDSAASGDHIYIDWGDGSAIERFSDVEVSDEASHTYAGTGPYRIRIWQQDFDRNNPDNDIAFDSFYKTTVWKGIPTSGKSKIISFGLIMHNCDTSNNQSGKGLGFGAPYRSGAGAAGWDTAYLQNYPIISSTSNKSLARLFQCNSGEPSIWKDPFGNNKKLYWFDNPDNSPADFNLCFFSQSNFNCYVGGWDLSNTTTIASLFRSTAFNNDGVDDLDNWDTSNVGSFSQTFRSSSFNHDLSSWSFASQTSLQRMFQSNGSFNQDISAWGTNDGGMAASTAFFNNMLDSTAMSVENYSKWIICLANWAYDNSYTTAEVLGGSGLQYNNTTYGGIGSGQYTDAVTARAYLVSTLGWTVNDSGQA